MLSRPKTVVVFVDQDGFFSFFVDQRNFVLYLPWSMASKQTKIMLAVPLCFRGMVASEQEIPVDITVEERYKTNWKQKLLLCEILSKSSWKGESIPDLQNWPSLYYMDIDKYLKDNSLSDCLLHRLKCEYKEGKGFRYFSCDFVKKNLLSWY